tara:strand:- start:1194 stop:1886 length:693 start_codon:yes stop_codon:yes gene_type:complete
MKTSEELPLIIATPVTSQEQNQVHAVAIPVYVKSELSFLEKGVSRNSKAKEILMMKNVNDGVLNMSSNEFTTAFKLIVYYELLPMTPDEREEFVKKLLPSALHAGSSGTNLLGIVKTMNDIEKIRPYTIDDIPPFSSYHSFKNPNMTFSALNDMVKEWMKTNENPTVLMYAIEDLRNTGTHRLLSKEVRIDVSQELMISKKRTFCQKLLWFSLWLFMLGIASLVYINNID